MYDMRWKLFIIKFKCKKVVLMQCVYKNKLLILFMSFMKRK